MRKILSLVVLLALAALALPAGAANSAHVVDPAGDANGLNGQGFVTGGAAGGTSTPLDYSNADILSVTYSTRTVAVPVGNDGVKHVATGLNAAIETTSPVSADGPTLIFRLNVEIGGCGGFVQYYLPGQAAGPLDGSGLEFRQFASRGCAADTTIRPASWKASFDGNVMTFEMPTSGLGGSDLVAFSAGRTVSTASAEVRTQLGVLTAPAIDMTGPGTDFTIGSDLPANVPCTSGCP